MGCAAKMVLSESIIIYRRASRRQCPGGMPTSCENVRVKWL
jgi:hypothetical protein